MFVGGSDCGYGGIVRGDHAGQIEEWTQEPVFTNVEGGMYLGELGGKRGYGLAVWGFIWGKDEAHFQAHRYSVASYQYDEQTAKMVKLEELITKGRYKSDEQALAEMRPHYPSFLRSTRDFRC